MYIHIHLLPACSAVTKSWDAGVEVRRVLVIGIWYCVMVREGERGKMRERERRQEREREKERERETESEC